MNSHAEMDDWGYESIPVPPDGSCFFTSISKAMNDSMHKWMDVPKIRDIMAHHIDRYKRINPGDEICSTQQISQKFIRYMSAAAMDETSLVMHNEEAAVLNSKKFKTPEALARHVLYTNCWADQSMIRSFLKSTNYMISVVLFDRRTKKPIFSPREWTFNKTFYICIQLERNHYTPLRLIFKETPLDMCTSRDVIRSLMSAIRSDYDFENMY